jgi:hypothetical protein
VVLVGGGAHLGYDTQICYKMKEEMLARHGMIR